MYLYCIENDWEFSKSSQYCEISIVVWNDNTFIFFKEKKNHNTFQGRP
jgi:hypothetical protein